MSSESSIDFVLKTVEERDIRFVRLWFTDVLGHLKSFSISPEELEEAFTEGIGFDGSAVDGFARLEESDMLAFPDANTFQLMPRKEGEHSAVARVFCDIRTPSRDPFDGDPRGVLERVFTQADEQGLVFNVGPKIEYFYFDNDLDPVPLDHCGYFDFSPTDSSLDLRRAISRECEKNGIPVQYSHHGNAESQNAIELRYNEAVSCADNIMATRLIIREQAAKRGFFASFMPKPLADYPGSAMFLYLSMFDHDGENLFWAPKESNDAHLSELAQYFVAGLLAYAPEYILVTNPTVNSYNRFTSDGVVPLYATWGRKDRSALVRIPTHKPGKHIATRVELRIPDPMANPYLSLAVVLAAGLKGVEEKLEMPAEAAAETRSLSADELKARGVVRLPRTLGEAVERFKASAVMRETLGDHIFDFLVDAKTREWEQFCTTVTDWERCRYYNL